MIGDHVRLLSRVRDEKTLETAFKYALHDRLESDYYYDCFELDFVLANRKSLIAELSNELADSDAYSPRPAYAYHAPKNNLVYRRMIYIPFKDLVVRYAFVTVLADLLDSALSGTCFANRRTRGHRATFALLEDFASVSWPKFCHWQFKCANEDGITTLLRTDIAAFYDSISHDYLVETISEELAVRPDSDLLMLFRSILRVPAISYSHLSKRPGPIEILRQGLTIGNTPDAFLANLYLKSADEVMNQVSGIQFGRYNDDMRIFASGRRQARDAVLVLQKELLAKGLNLNAAKTRIAESPADIEKLRSKTYEVYEYLPAEEEIGEAPGAPQELDQPFDSFSRRFEPGQELGDDKDAKEFCQFMSHRLDDRFDLLPIEERAVAHVQTLEEILTRWQGSSKHAAWLIIETACNERCQNETRREASEAFLRCLAHEDVATYAKYRLLHHLQKQRRTRARKSLFRHLDRLDQTTRKGLLELLPSLLQKPAFELNIVALYMLKLLGTSPNDLETYAQNFAPKPLGAPITNALLSVMEPGQAAAHLELVSEEETDSQPEYH